MMSPYKTLFSFTFCLVNYRQLKRSLRAGVLHSLSPQSPSFSFFPFLSIPCPFPRLLHRLRYMTVTNNRRSPSIIRNSKRQTQNPLKSLKNRFEAKGRLSDTTGKVIQRLFTIDLYTYLAIYHHG